MLFRSFGSCRHVIADILPRFGIAHTLVDGADLDAWQGEIQVGLTASRLLIEGLAPHFCAEGDRAIGLVSSVYANFVGGSQPVGYHVVKAGLNQMIRYYAWELGRQGIRANAVMPLTYIKPESRAFYHSKPDLLALYDRFVPLRRLGDRKSVV